MTVTQYTLADLMERRTAWKHFDPKRPVDDATLTRIFEAVRLTPTSFNIQHYRFLVLRDEASRKRLLPLAFNQPQISSGAVVLILADPLAYKKTAPLWRDYARDGFMSPEGAEKLIAMIEPCYDGDSVLQRDEALRSASYAAMVMMLAATEEGLESCPIIGFDHDAVMREFKIAEPWFVTLIVAFGHAPVGAHTRAHPPRLPLSELVWEERLGETPKWTRTQ